MPEIKTVKLSTPFEHHGATVDSVELREPSGGLYSQLGDPRIAVRDAEGGYWVEKDDTIKRYLDRCIVHQDGATLLGLMSMVDVMKLKEELFLFFAVAEGKIIAERAGSSSSAPASA